MDVEVLVGVEVGVDVCVVVEVGVLVEVNDKVIVDVGVIVGVDVITGVIVSANGNWSCTGIDVPAWPGFDVTDIVPDVTHKNAKINNGPTQ